MSFHLFQIISCFALCLVLFKTGESLLQIISAHPHWGRWSSLFAYSKKNIVCISAFLFSIYFIYLLIRFPGVCGADTVNQITDLVTGSAPLAESGTKGRMEISALLNDHHPVLTTLVFTLFYRFGQLIGNPNWGDVLLQFDSNCYISNSVCCHYLFHGSVSYSKAGRAVFFIFLCVSRNCLFCGFHAQGFAFFVVFCSLLYLVYQLCHVCE